MNNIVLEKLINTELNTETFQDYAPNGLQVEGRPEIKRIVTGVTASQLLLERAVEQKADAILVHHGYFWKNEPAVVRGMKRNRLKTLLAHDINLYGYHLPLDAHSVLGNNAQLAKRLDIEVQGKIESLLPYGEFKPPLDATILAKRLQILSERTVLHCGDNAPTKVQSVAWCTGGGQGYIQQAAEFGVDAFITGEVSEQTIHIAQEMGVNFYAAGHHATERYGIEALGKWLIDEHQLDVIFIDVPNPA